MQLHITPPEVDRMKPSQIAAVLGLDQYETVRAIPVGMETKRPTDTPPPPHGNMTDAPAPATRLRRVVGGGA